MVARLRGRRQEIEELVSLRLASIATRAHDDAEYREGLQNAVTAAVDYAFAAIESERQSPPPVPVPLLGQARLAARNRIGIDTVLRRYVAGYSLLGKLLVDELSEPSLRGLDTQALLASLADWFDRLISAITEEHARERDSLIASPVEREAEQIRRLLRGEPVLAETIAYEFDGWHMGFVVRGDGAREFVRRIARRAGARESMLVGSGVEGVTWAWIGTGGRPDPSEIRQQASQACEEGVSVAIGEPGHRMNGWRRTHREAGAVPLSHHHWGEAVRYADVAILTALARDELLASSLRTRYLAPLDRQRDEGEQAKETLRAYFRAGRSVSSAAALLGVKRHTVTNRLRAIERRIERPLLECSSELELVLRLEDFEEPSWTLRSTCTGQLGRNGSAHRLGG